MLYEMGKLDEAQAKLNAGLENDPDNRGAYYYLNLSKQANYARQEQNRTMKCKTRMCNVEGAAPLVGENRPCRILTFAECSLNGDSQKPTSHRPRRREMIYNKLDRLRHRNMSTTMTACH